MKFVKMHKGRDKKLVGVFQLCNKENSIIAETQPVIDVLFPRSAIRFCQPPRSRKAARSKEKFYCADFRP
jgi:hypothetical protein